MNEELITIKEFRRLAGKNFPDMSDEQVQGLICDLDFMAKDFINLYRKGVKDKLLKNKPSNT